MSDLDDRINELFYKIVSLRDKQVQIDKELSGIQKELFDLRKSVDTQPPSAEQHPPVAEQLSKSSHNITADNLRAEPRLQKLHRAIVPKQKLEDFIGTNLISKVGILITIIGIFIGAKYAIDKELISPAMRIFLGYVAAGGLFITATRLKNKYENFSAVLMGGALAVFYFITYIAYGFYHLFPQVLSFLLMVIITIATVRIALWFDLKIIAILGQVGAYAIPFLLSNGSGNVMILFSYISIINIGLLILSFRKNWRLLYRIAFFLTWFIYGTWLLNTTGQNPSITGMLFLFINFLTFYAAFLSYKVLRKELYNVTEITILLVNALFFFFFGTSVIHKFYADPHVLTYFTLLNAAIHFSVGVAIYRLKLADQTVFQFIAGLGLLFLTISIPVELNGSWVTLLWTVEATTLCWIAFKNERKAYLVITLPLVILAATSLLQDWIVVYPHLNNYSFNDPFHHTPFLNLPFWTSIAVSAGFGYMSWLSYSSKLDGVNLSAAFWKIILPVLFFLVLYGTFFNEIEYAWDREINYSSGKGGSLYLGRISLLIYSFLFVALALYTNRKYFKSSSGAMMLLIAAVLCSLFFLVIGLHSLGALRENYFVMKQQGLSPPVSELWVRYVCFLAFGILIWCCDSERDTIPANRTFTLVFSTIFNIALLAIICSEFINWMDIFGFKNQNKLGLTIIWGLYALVLVIVGIRSKKKFLRIGGIILFGLTLFKLFFYDLITLSTVSKTIVLVLLGVILLIVSFLYNKYKAVIFSDD